MTKPSSHASRAVLLILFAFACLLFAGAAVGIAVLVRTRGGHQHLQPLEVVPGVSHLDKTLGLDRVDGIEEEGFSYVEMSKTWGGDSFRWTLGHAKMSVPLQEPPQSLHVRLGVPISRTVPLRIQLNGKILLDEKVKVQGDWSRIFDVSTMDLGKLATIEIISDTFVPAEKHKDSTDQRTLGVCVRGITLLSAAQEFVDVVLGAQPMAGVLEGGFHGQEKTGNEPCRWTTGHAQLEVPIRSKTPKTLDLLLDVPNRPDFRVTVTVNGQKLFDDQLKANEKWSAQLPLAGVDLGKAAKIEITSSTFVPAKVYKGSTDGRELGVRVKQVKLNTVEAK